MYFLRLINFVVNELHFISVMRNKKINYLEKNISKTIPFPNVYSYLSKIHIYLK